MTLRFVILSLVLTFWVQLFNAFIVTNNQYTRSRR